MGYIGGTLAIQLTDGTTLVTGTLDGVPGEARKKLTTNYTDYYKVKALIKTGYINKIRETPESCLMEDDNCGYPKTIAGGLEGFEEYLKEIGREYTYLFINNEWYQSLSYNEWVELAQPQKKLLQPSPAKQEDEKPRYYHQYHKHTETQEHTSPHVLNKWCKFCENWRDSGTDAYFGECVAHNKKVECYYTCDLFLYSEEANKYHTEQIKESNKTEQKSTEPRGPQEETSENTATLVSMAIDKLHYIELESLKSKLKNYIQKGEKPQVAISSWKKKPTKNETTTIYNMAKEQLSQRELEIMLIEITEYINDLAGE